MKKRGSDMCGGVLYDLNDLLFFLTFLVTVSYRKIGGAVYFIVSPQIILLGEQLLLLLPRFPRLWTP